MSRLIDELLDARRERRLLTDPVPLLPPSLRDAYAMQDEHLERLLAEIGGDLGGYKVGVTDPAVLALLGLDRPYHGPVPTRFIHTGPATLPREGFFICIIEAEIAFRFGSALPAREGSVGPDAVAAAVDAVLPAIEVADSRAVLLPKPDARLIVADLGYSGALVVGTPVAAWRGMVLNEVPVCLARDGVEVAAGSGVAIMGDPFRTLCDCVTALHARGKSIEPGQIVSSGSCTPPLIQPGPARFDADFGPLGPVSLTLA